MPSLIIDSAFPSSISVLLILLLHTFDAGEAPLALY
uniref:Uncharacterized protein n=1 Tax=Utricularia reniformis TaxID=192314 RepID=A0A1Y0AZY3_9LAMI|nr:hypothetical protein AEK19_MT0424 [Utricularia reniformis]ART30688.1 hypothetical protein AEK19_MT0424 [Utricularia reniformis]